MSDKSNNQGRAYEFISLHSLYEAVKAIRPAEIVHNSSYESAERAWETIDEKNKNLYSLSAKSTIETIFALEPNIVEKNEDVLKLYIQPDQQGEIADVRDIIIERSDIIWEIGLSLKHNHMAVKHSRISKSLDFGEKWYNVKCSKTYWDEVKPTFDFLEKEKTKGTYFHDLKSKEDDVYLPLLNAFIKEITRQVKIDPTIPRKLVEYLLSKYDFYKVISLDHQRLTTIQSFNMYGTLNRASRVAKPSITVPTIKLPTIILYMGFKPKSKTTVIMSMDNGWQFSFRLHNAKDVIEPSLKFDVQIDGMPADVNLKFICKW
jgi:hypothetical protein